MKIYSFKFTHGKLEKIITSVVILLFVLSFVFVPSVFAIDPISLPNIHVFPLENFVEVSRGNGTPGLDCMLTIYDTEENIKFQEAFVYNPEDPYQVNITDITTIEVGDRVGLVSGSLVKEVVVTDLKVSEVNIKTDMISGTSDSEVPVRVTIFYDDGQNYRIAQVESGAWTANFATISTDEPFDITAQNSGTANQIDADGDSILVSWWAPNPELQINPLIDEMAGNGWMKGETIAIQIYTNSIEFQSFNAVVDETGCFTEDFKAQNVDLYAGQRVVVTDSMTEREFTISSIRVNAIDVAADLVYGSIEPGGYVQVIVMNGEEPIFREPIPNAAGEWVADYSEIYTDSEGNVNPIFDLTNETEVYIRNYDGNNNATVAFYTANDFISVLLGDINLDTLVNKADGTMLLKYLAGRLELDATQLAAADYNEDGIVNITDAKLIIKFADKKHH